MAKLNILRIFGIFLVLNSVTLCVYMVYRYKDNGLKYLKVNSCERSETFRYGDKYAPSSSLGVTGYYRQRRYRYFTGEYVLNRTPVNAWVDKEHTKEFCDGRVKIYHDKFAIIRNVVMFPLKRIGSANQAKGGEEIRFVLNQGLERENYMFQKSFFEMNCKSGVNLDPYSGSIGLLNALTVNINKTELDFVENKNISKIAYAVTVQRGDYANLHNWARNIYDTFLVMMYFQIQPSQVKIMFMDGHPATELDKAWSVIYSPPLRVGHLTNPVRIQNLILGIDENVGLVSEYRNEHVPFLEEFRSFVLSQFDLDDKATLNCLNLKVTVILRRNAIYHPRNVIGNVGRKIFNEATLINDLMAAFPSADVTSVLMESLPMRMQLLQVSQSDVLIGMHGAGMTHILFLPKHAAVLEMFSKDFKVNRPWYQCYQSIAAWRNMTYDNWENFDSSLEMPADFTIIPSGVIVNKTKSLINSICKTHPF